MSENREEEELAENRILQDDLGTEIIGKKTEDLAIEPSANDDIQATTSASDVIITLTEAVIEKSEGCEKITYSAAFESSNRWYENLKTYSTNSSLAENSTIATSTQFFAYLDQQGSGSSIAVLPYSSIGKNHIPVNSPAYQQPIIRAHSQLVADFAFSPFRGNVLYSCAPDRLLKIWKLPEEGLTVDMSVANSSLSTKSKAALRSLAVSSIIDNLVAARGGREISLFDVIAGREIYTTTDSNSFFQGDILDMVWSYYNDYLFTTSKDKLIRLFDPRINPKQFTVAKQWAGHSGFRFANVIPVEDTVSLFSLGHNSKTQEREVFLWDLRKTETGPVVQHVVDKKEGQLYSVYDDDHHFLYVSGKGDSHLHIYKTSTTGSALEEVLDQSILTDSLNGRDVVKGIALLPKISSLIKSSQEVGRILKLSEGLIQPVIISASTAVIPPEGMITRCAAPPALSVGEWSEGAVKPPRTVVVVPSEDISTSDELEDNSAPEKNDGESGSGNRDSVDVGSSKRASALRVSQSTMKYRHIYGKEPKKELTYYNLQPDLTALDSPIIAGNEHYWAIPYRGGGGPVYLSTHSNFGKVLPECLTLNSHKATVQEIAFSPFHEDIMLTGSYDCTMKLWNVRSALEAYEEQLKEAQAKKTFPKVTSVSMTWTETIGEFRQHTNSIRTINFHPTVPNLFCSTGQDMTLRFFDLNTMEEISCLNVATATADNQGSSASELANSLITNLSFNFDGTQLLMASKDRQLRWIDPRRNQLIDTIQHAKYLGRNLRVAWCARSLSEDPVVTVSAGNGGMRQIALWDKRNWKEPAAVRMIDNASGQLFPLYDEGLNVVYVAGKGDTMIRGFEISALNNAPSASHDSEAPTSSPADDYHYLFEKCFDYQTLGRETIAGVCLLPKRVVDYRQVEVSRMLKLSTDTVIPIHFHVPRADYLKEYFHDDIYLPVRSNQDSSATMLDWKNLSLSEAETATIFAPVMESLKPADMTAVSEKPVTPVPSERNSKIQSYRANIAQKAEETKQNEEKFNRLQQLAFQNAQYHKNASGPMKIGSVVVSNPQLKEAVNNLTAEEEDSDENDWD